jgi:hypothetical protein
MNKLITAILLIATFIAVGVTCQDNINNELKRNNTIRFVGQKITNFNQYQVEDWDESEMILSANDTTDNRLIVLNSVDSTFVEYR